MDNQKIISLAKAIEIATSKIVPKPIENVLFTDALGRVLASDVFSDVHMPPFNKSAMDGYACRKVDLGKNLKVLEVIPAGKSPKYEIKEGKCSKIMTGAMVPDGADTVFMVEHSEEIEDGFVRFTKDKTSSNICLFGEDVQQGDLVLNAGTLLKAQHVAMLSAVACVQPEVYQQASVGIISTGSELVEPGKKLKPSQIRNSNGHQMYVQSSQIGCKVNYYGIVEDDRHTTLKMVKKSTEENDVTLISGGVSVGDFDYVPLVIEDLGFEIFFSKLSVKPGKHNTFAAKDNKFIIGLPGNPVSSFVQFELFVKPFLNKLMGNDAIAVEFPLVLGSDFKRRRVDREEFVPIVLNEKSEVERVSYNGSAHIHAYHEAFGVMNIPQGVDQIKKGEIVYVRPL